MSGPEQPNNPLHGVTLKAMLEHLVERRGWEELGRRIRVRCFVENPSISSSLKFLRKTDWARKKVEEFYLEDLRLIERNRKRNKRRAAMRAYRLEHETSDDGNAGTLGNAGTAGNDSAEGNDSTDGTDCGGNTGHDTGQDADTDSRRPPTASS